MIRAVPVSAAMLLMVALSAVPAAAQFGAIRTPDTWVSIWVGGFLDPGTVSHPESVRDFGPAMALGAGVHRGLGRSVQIGFDASLAPSTPYELTPRNGGDMVRGSARLATLLASGRLRYGGFDSLGMYLTGGVGAFAYGLPDEGWDTNLALLTGAGVEFRPSGARAIFLEWGQYRAYHGGESVRSSTTRHSQLRFGGRMAW